MIIRRLAKDKTIYSGSGNDHVAAVEGNDQVIYLHACELKVTSIVSGGNRVDRLVLPVSKDDARSYGLSFDRFEHIVEMSPAHRYLPVAKNKRVKTKTPNTVFVWRYLFVGFVNAGLVVKITGVV